MTRLKFIENGVEREIGEACGKCEGFFPFQQIFATGMCKNKYSDHFAHVLVRDHPACEKYTKKRDAN